MPMTLHPTLCRCCSAACAILVERDGDRIVRVHGDRDNARTRGYVCAKGASLPDFHHHPDRLEGAWLRGRESDVDRCLDDLSSELGRLIEQHGPDCLGVYQGTGAVSDSLAIPTIQALLEKVGSSQFYSAATVDVAPAFRAAEMVCGSSTLFPTWVPEDEAGSFLLCLGFNPAVSHGYLTMLPDATRRMQRFRERGGRIWVVDPRKTRTASLADEHLAIRPGTDGLLLAWLVRELMRKGADFEDLEAMTAEEDRAALERALQPFTLETVSRATGLPRSKLRGLLAEIRRAGRIAVTAATGITLGQHALVTEWLRWALLIVTGSLDRSGGMWFNPGWLARLDERSDWQSAPPEGHVGPGPASRPELIRSLDQNPCVALADEIEAGHLRALIVAGGSPLTAFPDPVRTEAALRSLDLLVTIDIQHTPLTKISSHVLPATGQLERADLVHETQTALAPAVVEPVADRRPMWWLVAQIGRRLGHDLLDGFDPEEATDESLIRRMVASGRAGRDAAEELVRAGSRGLDPSRAVGWVRAHALPDGRFRLAPDQLLKRLPDLLADDWPGEGDLMLVSSRQLRRTNSTSYVPKTSSRNEPVLHVHPIDARAAGLSKGDRARLETDSGSVLAELQLDSELRPGVVSLSHGGYDPNVCRLTSSVERVDPLTGQPQMTGLAVRLGGRPPREPERRSPDLENFDRGAQSKVE